MAILVAVIIILNYKKKLNNFVFAEMKYGLIEKLYILFYCFWLMDEFGIKYSRFDMNYE